MAKLTKKTLNNDKGRQQLTEEINFIKAEIDALQAKKVALQEELLNIDLKPFKIGGYALAEVSSGRNKKWQKCLLECEGGLLYLRPVKSDGELSGRHFLLFPAKNYDYSEYLKEVK